MHFSRVGFAVDLFQIGFDDMKVALGCGQVFMAKKLLDMSEISTGFEHFRGKRVPERVGCDFLLDLRPLLVGIEFVKEPALVHVPPEP